METCMVCMFHVPIDMKLHVSIMFPCIVHVPFRAHVTLPPLTHNSSLDGDEASNTQHVLSSHRRSLKPIPSALDSDTALL